MGAHSLRWHPPNRDYLLHYFGLVVFVSVKDTPDRFQGTLSKKKL